MLSTSHDRQRVDCAITVDHKFLGLELEGTQAVQVLDQMNCAVGVDRGIRKPRWGVASDSAAAEAFQTKSDVLGEDPASARAEAAPFFRGVERSSSAGAGNTVAGSDAGV